MAALAGPVRCRRVRLRGCDQREQARRRHAGGAGHVLLLRPGRPELQPKPRRGGRRGGVQPERQFLVPGPAADAERQQPAVRHLVLVHLRTIGLEPCVRAGQGLLRHRRLVGRRRQWNQRLAGRTAHVRRLLRHHGRRCGRGLVLQRHGQHRVLEHSGCARRRRRSADRRHRRELVGFLHQAEHQRQQEHLSAMGNRPQRRQRQQRDPWAAHGDAALRRRLVAGRLLLLRSRSLRLWRGHLHLRWIARERHRCDLYREHAAGDQDRGPVQHVHRARQCPLGRVGRHHRQHSGRRRAHRVARGRLPAHERRLQPLERDNRQLHRYAAP